MGVSVTMAGRPACGRGRASSWVPRWVQACRKLADRLAEGGLRASWGVGLLGQKLRTDGVGLTWHTALAMAGQSSDWSHWASKLRLQCRESVDCTARLAGERAV